MYVKLTKNNLFVTDVTLNTLSDIKDHVTTAHNVTVPSQVPTSSSGVSDLRAALYT